MSQFWQAYFSDEELAEIAAAPEGSIVARMAKLLERFSPAAPDSIPDRADLPFMDRQQWERAGRIQRLDEGG